MVVAIAIGVGVGIGHTRRLTSLVEPLPAPLQNKILQDSSFAAVTTRERIRFIIFQDIHGHVRQSIRDSWFLESYPDYFLEDWATTPSDSIVTIDAKNHTPLTAFLDDSKNHVSRAGS